MPPTENSIDAQRTRRIRMVRGTLIFSIIGSVALLVAAVLHTVTRQSADPFIDPANEALVIQGKAIYANSCAACHGASLQGQPEWRTRLPNGRLPAPPHDATGHTWHHPDAVLLDIIKNGLVPGRTAPPGYVSDMPAFGTALSDEEMTAVLAYIKSTWPPKILQLQKEVDLQQRKRAG